MSEVRKVQVGEAVTYVDELRVERAALVTFVWSNNIINLVYVSGDPNREDSCGRQTIRETSVSHISAQGDNVVGRCWK